MYCREFSGTIVTRYVLLKNFVLYTNIIRFTQFSQLTWNSKNHTFHLFFVSSGCELKPWPPKAHCSLTSSQATTTCPGKSNAEMTYVMYIANATTRPFHYQHNQFQYLRAKVIHSIPYATVHVVGEDNYFNSMELRFRASAVTSQTTWIFTSLFQLYFFAVYCYKQNSVIDTSVPWLQWIESESDISATLIYYFRDIYGKLKRRIYKKGLMHIIVDTIVISYTTLSDLLLNVTDTRNFRYVRETTMSTVVTLSSWAKMCWSLNWQRLNSSDFKTLFNLG
jgi:hypothetical protein